MNRMPILSVVATGALTLAVALVVDSGAVAADEPRVPGAVVECPAWLRPDAPFDVTKFFEMPPASQNAAPLYLDALAEFGTEVLDCLPADQKARKFDAISKRAARLRQFSDILEKAPRSLDRRAADALLDELLEGFRKLDLAQKRPRCVFAIGISFDSPLPHVQSAREVIRAARLRSFRDVERGDLDRPIHDLSACLRLSRDLRPRGPIISQLVSAAMDGIGCLQIVPSILGSPTLTAEQCDRLLAVLKEHEARSLDPFPAGCRAEYVMDRATLRVFQDHLLTEADRNGRPVVTPLDENDVAKTLLRLTSATSAIVPGVTSIDDPESVRKTVAFLRAHKAAWPGEREAFDAFARATTKSSPAVYGERVRALDAAMAPYLGREGPDSLWLARLLVPGFEPAVLALDRVATYLRATECLVAVRRWQITHKGANPADLASACTDAKLAPVPIDPFSGKPLKMTTIDGRLVVYSVGPDGVDDKARKDSDLGRKPEGDLLFGLPVVR